MRPVVKTVSVTDYSRSLTNTVATPKAVCHPNPCLNGGMCKETGANQDFDCICPNAQYKGRFCDGKQTIKVAFGEPRFIQQRNNIMLK